MGIAGNQGMLVIQNAVAAQAGNAAVYEPVVRGIPGNNGKYPGTYDTAMHLNLVDIFTH